MKCCSGNLAVPSVAHTSLDLGVVSSSPTLGIEPNFKKEREEEEEKEKERKEPGQNKCLKN